MSEKWKGWCLGILMGLGALTVGGLFAWVGWGISLKNAGPEMTLPLIVITGVVVLLITLALVAVTFALLDLDDRKQALALPEGSVRAVIALMLLVVFAIAAIFLYSNVSASGKLRVLEDLTYDQVKNLQRYVTVVLVQPPLVEPTSAPAAATAPTPGALPSETTSAGTPPVGTPPAATPPTGTSPAETRPAGPPATAKTYTVHYREPSSEAGNDIAKQLIVLLGTLVTAVASFYFGSSSVSSARDAADRARVRMGGPNAASVDPTTIDPDGKSHRLTITGTNLDNVKAAKLLSPDGKDSLLADAGSIKANATVVTCTLTVPAGTAAGKWDVVVSDNANNDSTIPKAVTINAPAAPAQEASESAAGPKVDKFDPPALHLGGDPQPLTVSGSNLGKVDGVKLLLEGKDDIVCDAGSFQPGDTEVKCNVTIKADTEPGDRGVALFEGTNKVATAPTTIKIS